MYNTSSKSIESLNFIKKYPLLFKKFRVLKHLAKGAFSEIYSGMNILTKERVAIKVEPRYSLDKYLEAECYFLFSLKGLGIPKVISFGHNKEYDILIMPLLGKSLHEIQMTKNFNFEFKDICLIAIQIIERIQWIHSQKIIHRDIKPDNFLIGLNDPNIIYLIDFGLSKKYRSSLTGNHIKNSKIKKFVGSLRYASINALKLREQSRRDDLESIGYMLIYLVKRRLPWDNVKVENKRSFYLRLSQYKKNLEPELLCKNLPKEFAEYIKYVKNLNFEDEPDYNYLKSLFKVLLNKQGFEEGKIFFSWINESNIYKIKKSINLSIRSSSSRGRILKRLKKSMDSKRSTSEINKRDSYENPDEIESNKLTNDFKIRQMKEKLNDNSETYKHNNNYENKPIINNYIYSYISPTNNININNKLYNNHYEYNFTSYNPFIMKNRENKNNEKQNINLNYLRTPRMQNNFEINYNPIITNNNDNNIYQLNKNDENHFQDINNKFINQNYHNNFNIKLKNINKSFGTNILLNSSYPYKRENNYQFQQKQNENNFNKVPLSSLNQNTNIKIINIKNPIGVKSFKYFNLWNISPFKKRNNNSQSQKNRRNNNINKIDYNYGQKQLEEQIKKFNKKYNENLGKNDKILIKNKMKKIKMFQYMPTNQSADNNKIRHYKNKFKNQRSNTDKNCIIF